MTRAEFVELVVRVQSSNFSLSPGGKETLLGNGGQYAMNRLYSDCEDESTTALLLNRSGTAMNYYVTGEPPAVAGGSMQPREVAVGGGEPPLLAETSKVGRPVRPTGPKIELATTR